ncbi:MAG TPA: NfeD family protein [Candidatus Intestinimonas pullistercoris]|uniref:NfeD family protein n=1 Tax=Candidatus Intestinimonas pullistercoris TaxID=2838623 RepID=A0A9D2T1M9_9FIRM|nr:NfeD family protein [uncultured Intestinimonas sp.]HJC41820.1 NfeD family protein [Candidatus Intestinimonas pullistercoris]
MSMSLFWLIAMVLFGVLEAVTVGLTSIWFAVGALAALIAASLGAFALVQVIVFLVVSFVTLLLVRPLAQRYINDRKEPTNADRVIGREAVVTQAIDNLKGEGQVNVSGAVWTARSQEEAPIPAGARVRVLRIEGVKVIVSPVPEGAAVSGGEDGRL